MFAAHPPRTCHLAATRHACRRQHMLQQRHRSWAALAGDPRELLQEAGVINSGTAW